MKEIKINSELSVSLYSSMKELPIELSKKFNAYVLQDAGIGNSMVDVDNHLGKLMLFINSDKRSEALAEVKNLRFNFFSMLSGWNYKSLSFGCLIARVNGQPVVDYSPEGIAALIERLSESGLNERMVADTIEEVKKNLIPNASSFFQNTLETI